MLSAITVSLVAEARQGPFVFHEGLEHACQQAASLGFDAIEIFPPDADAIPTDTVRDLLNKYQLKLAAVGTGAGWVRHQLTLVAAEADARSRASAFIKNIIDAAGRLGAPAIVGSMQGRAASLDERSSTLELLGQMLTPLADYAGQQYGLPLLIEPLNRYETNLLNDLPSTAQWLQSLPTRNLRILADLFHMNIEEANLADSIVQAGPLVGHVHFADSNRRAIGLGHTEMHSVMKALRQIQYKGYLSAEIFPRPDTATAASTTIKSFRDLVSRS